MSNIEIRRVDEGVGSVLVDGQEVGDGITFATLHIGPRHAVLTVEPYLHAWDHYGKLVASMGHEILHALITGVVEVPPETRTTLIALGWTPPSEGDRG